MKALKIKTPVMYQDSLKTGLAARNKKGYFGGCFWLAVRSSLC